MEREVGRRFKRDGTDVYLWLIHVDVWQKSSQYCKVIILPLKIKFKKKFQGEGLVGPLSSGISGFEKQLHPLWSWLMVPPSGLEAGRIENGLGG